MSFWLCLIFYPGLSKIEEKNPIFKNEIMIYLLVPFILTCRLLNSLFFFSIQNISSNKHYKCNKNEQLDTVKRERIDVINRFESFKTSNVKTTLEKTNENTKST